MSSARGRTQLEQMQARITALRARLGEAHDKTPAISSEALDDLSTTLEELRVAQEEINDQNNDLRAAQGQIDQERQRYHDLFDFAPDGYMVTDAAGTILEANIAAAALLGAPAAVLCGKPLTVFVAEKDKRSFREALIRWQRARTDSVKWEFELVGRAKEPMAAEATVAPIWSSTNQVIGLRWMLRDITERRQAEVHIRQLNANLEERVRERTEELRAANADLEDDIAERQRAEVALRQALERSRDLYQISQSIGLVHSPDDVLQALMLSNHLKRVHRAGILLFNKPWQDALPANCHVLASWRGESQLPAIVGQVFELKKYGFESLFERDQPVHIEDVTNDPRLNDAARALFLSIQSRSLLLFPLIAAGQWYGMLTMHTGAPNAVSSEDIRHLRGLVDQAAVAIYNIRLLETEAEARQEAEKANQLKLKFLAMISHELRTPLTSIKGFATTLLARDVTWDEIDQRDFISTINTEADKLTEMIEQLLDLSRLEAGQLRIQLAAHALADIVSRAAPTLRTIAAQHALRIELDPTLPPVRADAQRNVSRGLQQLRSRV
jgi:PAS domain S-box-containing protein